jgi:hypothetical protein
MSAAQELLELAREELAHAVAGRWEALDALHERRVALLAEIPFTLEAADRQALLAAQELHAAVAGLLRDGLQRTREQLVALGRGRQGAQAYAAATRR